MGDDDNGMTSFTHIAKDSKQLFRFLWCQNRCRLIQDQDIHTAVKQFDNFYCLFLRHGHSVYFLVWIQIKAIAAGQFIDLCRNTFHIQYFFSRKS